MVKNPLNEVISHTQDARASSRDDGFAAYGCWQLRGERTLPCDGKYIGEDRSSRGRVHMPKHPSALYVVNLPIHTNRCQSQGHWQGSPQNYSTVDSEVSRVKTYVHALRGHLAQSAAALKTGRTARNSSMGVPRASR